MVEILSDYELEKMRAAGKLVAKILKELEKAAKPGVSTLELDDLAQKIIKEAGGTAPCVGYGNPPFPCAICTSVNDEVVHGIPTNDIILQDGDIVTCDVVASLDGYCGDAARTFLIGNVDEETRLHPSVLLLTVVLIIIVAYLTKRYFVVPIYSQLVKNK